MIPGAGGGTAGTGLAADDERGVGRDERLLQLDVIGEVGRCLRRTAAGDERACPLRTSRRGQAGSCGRTKPVARVSRIAGSGTDGDLGDGGRADGIGGKTSMSRTRPLRPFGPM